MKRHQIKRAKRQWTDPETGQLENDYCQQCERIFDPDDLNYSNCGEMGYCNDCHTERKRNNDRNRVRSLRGCN